MKLLLVYGSLRAHSQRGYNFDRFGKGTQKFIRFVEVPGYDLYDLGAYPCITPGDGNLKAELHEVDDTAAAYITRMEQGAGYYSTTVMLPEGEAEMYYMRKPPSHAKQVVSGNWD